MTKRQELITAALARAQRIQENNHASATRAANVEANGGAAPKGLRYKEPASAPSQREWKPALTHYVFCQHMRPYFQTCTKCKRDSALAERNRKMFFPSIAV